MKTSPGGGSWIDGAAHAVRAALREDGRLLLGAAAFAAASFAVYRLVVGLGLLR